MNKNSNSFEIIFDSKSENESFARVVVAAFCTRLDPTLEEISDIKTAVSEAVTNCIVHGYEGREGKISLKCELNDNELTIEVHDDGVGIDDIERASTIEIFEKVYEIFGADNAQQVKLLEITYAVGLALGIIIFYNHFAGVRLSGEPTPIEVEMDKYEKDVDDTLIDRKSKTEQKGKKA